MLKTNLCIQLIAFAVVGLWLGVARSSAGMTPTTCPSPNDQTTGDDHKHPLLADWMDWKSKMPWPGTDDYSGPCPTADGDWNTDKPKDGKGMDFWDWKHCDSSGNSSGNCDSGTDPSDSNSNASQSVPEPSSLCLLAVSAIGLHGRRRKTAQL